MGNRVFEIVEKVEAAVKVAIEKHIEVNKEQTGEQLHSKHFDVAGLVLHFTNFIHTAYGRKVNRQEIEDSINEDGTLDLDKLYLVGPQFLYGSVAKTIATSYMDPEACLTEFRERSFGFSRVFPGEVKSAAEWFGGRLWKDTSLGFVWDVEAVGAEIEEFLGELAEEGRLRLYDRLEYVIAPVMEGMADRHRKMLVPAF